MSIGGSFSTSLRALVSVIGLCDIEVVFEVKIQ